MNRLTPSGLLAAGLILSSALAQTSHFSASSGTLDLSPAIAKGLTGLTWDGKEFIGSYGIRDVPLVSISPDGQKVSRFAPSFTGKDEVYAALSAGRAGFPAGYYYLNFDQWIYEIDPTGDHVRLFSSPPGANRTSYVAFDNVGSWGYNLLALDDDGLLWSITADGTAKTLANFSNFGSGPTLKPEGIAIAPQSFGALAGYLFVTLEGAERIVAIPPGNTSRVITLFQFTNEEPERVLQIPARSDLYVAEFDSGQILRVPAANFSAYANSLVVITEGENEPFGSLNVVQPFGNNITVTRIGTVPDRPHFEGGSFVPSSASVPWGQSGQPAGLSASNPLLIVGAVVLVAVIVFAGVFALRRRTSLGT